MKTKKWRKKQWKDDEQADEQDAVQFNRPAQPKASVDESRGEGEAWLAVFGSLEERELHVDVAVDEHAK